MRAQDGNVAVIVALSLSVLLGMGAVVLDVAYGRHVQQELQNATDAAAHAAVMQLDGTSVGLTNAHNMAVTLAAKNKAAGSYVSIDANLSNDASGDVVTGIWDSSASTFTPSLDPASVNSLRVRARFDSMSLLFSPMAASMGRDGSIPVSAETTTLQGPVSGAGAVDCFIPLAIPSCLVTLYGGYTALQNHTLNLNPPQIDAAGWARPFTWPSSSWTQNQLSSCAFQGEVAIGDELYLQNGSVNSAYNAMAAAVTASTTTYGTSRWGTIPARDSKSIIPAASYGHTYEAPIIVFESDSSYCTGSGGSFSDHHPIAGFMWAAVYEVTSGNASERTIKLRLDPVNVHAVGTRGGGPNWGVTSEYRPPYLVSE